MYIECYCESEKQNVCVGTERLLGVFTLTITRLPPVMALCCHPQSLERMVLKSQPQEKVKIQSTVNAECTLLLHHPKVKTHKLNHWKFRTIWMYVSKVYLLWASKVVLVVKNQSANARDAALIPELGRSLGEGNATHSSILARKILYTEQPG